MKQKRKVKSLISSESDNSVLLSTLLFLLGGVLVFGAVALFTSSVGVVSAEGEGDAFEYENGIADNVEVLLNLKFAPDGGSATVNEMEFDGTTFYMEEGNKGISVKDSSAAIRDDAYINYLGGNSSATQINLASNNIAVIGGNGVKVLQGNDNATSLGGNATRISEGGNSVPAVMLGGQTNTIGTNQIGNAIVGGSNNSISNAGQYDFIIGGSNNNINANNVIVGGAKVTANQSNIFVFNDGESSFTPQGGNAFYLNMQHGLGLNRAARNKGVDSEGAVSFGLINIGTQSCASTDVGVEGNWNGCLVGCTQASSASNKWEMIDHGDICEGLCQAEEKCMVNPIVPLPPEDYPSACTVGGVDTNHSTQCAANRLEVYENVMFETFLIDSDDDCANYDTHQNKCIFKCEKDYHLTGNVAGGSSTTKKCYKDCTLPWNGEKIKHNETRIAYNAKNVSCSNTEWVFPLTTAIVNAPTKSPNLEYPSTRTINNMLKTTDAAGKSYESCTNYTHKKTLVCYDGELYIANTNGTKSDTKALGGSGAWYGYDVCTTRDYKCPTTTYNLTQNYITTNSIAKDTVTRNNTDRSTSIGTRGQYKLCQDWTPSVGNSECKVGLNGANGTVADNYHYQLVKCNTHYSTGTDNNPYECKKSCSIKNLAGNETRTDASGKEYLHGSVISGYQNNSVDCTVNGNGSCKVDTIVCNDGERRMRTMNGPKNTLYLYNDCKLNAYKCDARFDLGQTWAHGSYDNCDPYNPNGRFQCVIQPRKYDLVGCDTNYHTENNQNCTQNSKSARCNTTGKPDHASYDYTYETIYWRCAWNGTPVSSCWSPVLNDCDWYCNSNYHLEGTYSCVYNTRTIDCSDFVALPTYAHWDGNGQGSQGWVGTWDSGNWSPNVSGCGWSCDPGYEGDNCNDVITCDCRNNPDYSYCVDTNVQIDEPAVCDYDCYYGSKNADGSCPPPPPPPFEGCTGCPSVAGGSVENGGTCTSYDADCNYIYSICSDGEWLFGDNPGPYWPAPSQCGGCSSDTYEYNGCEYLIPSMSNNTSTTAWNITDGYDGSVTATCSEGILTYSDKTCDEEIGVPVIPQSYECSEGYYLPKGKTTCSQCPCGSSCPGGAWPKSTTSDQGISKCESGKYSAAGSNSCSTCDTSTHDLSSDQCSCTPKYEESYCGTTHWTCTNGGTATNKKATDGSDKYTWDCPDETGCSEKCPNGQTLHNGECKQKTNGSCKLNWRYDCWAGDSINNKLLNYVYTWDCAGINGGTTDNCSVDCHISCTEGTTYACHTEDGFYTNGTNQKTDRNSSAKTFKFEWDCGAPSPCDGVSSPSSLHCTCVSKSCMDYGYQDAYGETPRQIANQGMESVEVTESNCGTRLTCKQPIPILYVYLAPDWCVGNEGKCGLGFNTVEGDGTTWTVQKTSGVVNLSYCIQGEGTSGLPRCEDDRGNIDTSACSLNGINLASDDGSQVGANSWRFSDGSVVTVNVIPSGPC